jgi:hypothetical protein
VLVIGVFFAYSAFAIQPNGAIINARPPETSFGNSTAADDAFAQAGNITELIITGTAVTQAWQGYYGNVSGTIELADASGDMMYNWSGYTNPTGEVYASTNSTISWVNVQCFNYTAEGNFSTDGETAGGTSLYGLNLSQLETMYGIATSDADGVDTTFTGANSHVEFYTANKQFSAGECVSSDIFDSAGKSTDGNFEEALLYEPTTASVVFVSILESNQAGFDNKPHDFEMLVLENGHSGDTTSTTYYFFTELQ